MATNQTVTDERNAARIPANGDIIWNCGHEFIVFNAAIETDLRTGRKLLRYTGVCTKHDANDDIRYTSYNGGRYGWAIPEGSPVHIERDDIPAGHDSADYDNACIDALGVLKQIVGDVTEMRDANDYYGPFSVWESNDGCVGIEWPNLGILIDSAKEIIARAEKAK